MKFKDKIRQWYSGFGSSLDRKVKSLTAEDKAGLYLTVIFHLAIVIVLLIFQIGHLATGDKGILLDFSKEDEQERLEKEELFKDDVSEKLDAMIREALSNIDVRNVAVDMSEPLRDDQGTDVEELMREAQRVQDELKSNAFKEDAREETVDTDALEQRGEGEHEYRGPSVISYTLDGRKASSLKVPAYRCMGAGEVSVIIVVDPQGNVVNAKVMEDVSATDQCLRDYAIRAARLSRFSALPSDRLKKDKSLARQTGEIVYRFIAQ